ncbi:transposase IS116/IS110/IS902 family protein [Desulfurobacterium thermolithotrophum DSM 11699]|uniref:Transposase IS116/IS110/IS902 family protein n=1 Tax=Desulfurobacterium thermolithotrophum (strain DSM 11699 / BSA) TaxID=868864 RepID=F0S1B3_DESTD|nr:IS110 family transposase [Desulfurobacterium thermolithotrophum]ADY72844.1 transposase IS116/IS110/IS902 family protein [Desulfurobacterium thermolithotrophum DSM 11699]
MSPPEIRDYSKEATFKGRRLDFSLGNKPRAWRLADASCRLIIVAGSAVLEYGNSSEAEVAKHKTYQGVEMKEKVEKTLYVGVDYHKNSFTAAYLDCLTGILNTKKYEAEELEKFKNHLTTFRKKGYSVKVAVETLTGVTFFTEEIRNCVDEITYVNTNKFKNILKGVNSAKNDRIDAETIAIYYEMGLLPTVYVPTRKEKELRIKMKERDSFVDMRKGVINRLHSLLLEYGIKTNKRELTTKKGMERIKEETKKKVPPSLRETIWRQIETIEYLTDKIRETEEDIKSFIGEDEELKGKVELLKSIPGVGDIVAIAFISAVCNEERFENGDKVAAYFGLVPRANSSGDEVRNGRITKKGDSRTRNKIIQATRALLNSKLDNSVKRFYEGLVKKGLEKKKALIAAARKLVKVMFAVLRERRQFMDFVENKCNLCVGG